MTSHFGGDKNRVLRGKRMTCYKSGGCGVYEMYSCSECPASKHEYKNKNKEVNPNYIPPASVKVKGDVHMENLRYCPLCGKDMNSNEIHLCGGTPTLIHSCISGIQIKIQADTEHEVARKWNTFVTVANK